MGMLLHKHLVEQEAEKSAPVPEEKPVEKKPRANKKPAEKAEK